MNKKTLLTILQYVVFLGLGVGIIYWMMSKLSPEQRSSMLDAIKATRLWMLVPIFIIGFLSHWFRALRWKLLLEPMDIRPTTANTFFAVMIGYVTNLAIPRAGEVAKCTVLARYEKVPADKMIGTIVAERAFDVVCLGIIVLMAFFLEADVVGKMINDAMGGSGGNHTNLYLILIGGMLLGIAAVIIVYRKFKHTKVGKFIKGLADGVMSIFKLKKSGMFLLYTLLIWGAYWFLIVLGFWSMPITEHLGLSVALVVLVAGSIGMIGTQGGIGLYPLAVGKTLLVYGVAEANGIAFGWVSWSVQVGIILVLGVISLILLPILNRKQHNAQVTVDRK